MIGWGKLFARRNNFRKTHKRLMFPESLPLSHCSTPVQLNFGDRMGRDTLHMEWNQFCRKGFRRAISTNYKVTHSICRITNNVAPTNMFCPKAKSWLHTYFAMFLHSIFEITCQSWWEILWRKFLEWGGVMIRCVIVEPLVSKVVHCWLIPNLTWCKRTVLP